jgi:hypothetical protein
MPSVNNMRSPLPIIVADPGVNPTCIYDDTLLSESAAVRNLSLPLTSLVKAYWGVKSASWDITYDFHSATYEDWTGHVSGSGTIDMSATTPAQRVLFRPNLLDGGGDVSWSAIRSGGIPPESGTGNGVTASFVMLLAIARAFVDAPTYQQVYVTKSGSNYLSCVQCTIDLYDNGTYPNFEYPPTLVDANQLAGGGAQDSVLTSPLTLTIDGVAFSVPLYLQADAGLGFTGSGTINLNLDTFWPP